MTVTVSLIVNEIVVDTVIIRRNTVMSVQVEKMEHNMAKLTIEVSAEELEKAIEGAYHKNKNKINIPGFRTVSYTHLTLPTICSV